jgi:hypothetical protein
MGDTRRHLRFQSACVALTPTPPPIRFAGEGLFDDAGAYFCATVVFLPQFGREESSPYAHNDS